MNYTVTSYFDIDPSWETNAEYNYRNKRKNKYIVGAMYSLKRNIGITDNITTNTIIETVYRLYGIAHNVNGMPFNGLVMKRIGGMVDGGLRFALSKQQCKVLHIKYQQGLEVFPMTMKFNKLVERFPNKNQKFVETDLSTYPHCVIDGTIRHILIKLNDYTLRRGSLIKIKNKNNGNVLSVRENNDGLLVINNITFRAKDCIKTPNGEVIYHNGDNIYYNLLTDLKGNDVYIELLFGIPTKGCYTEDGHIGIDINRLINKKFEDIIRQV